MKDREQQASALTEGQVLFTRPVLERHHDFEIGIQVLSELTSISASSCHFQSREIRIN